MTGDMIDLINHWVNHVIYSLVIRSSSPHRNRQRVKREPMPHNKVSRKIPPSKILLQAKQIPTQNKRHLYIKTRKH